jgi:hypothetical protein
MSGAAGLHSGRPRGILTAVKSFVFNRAAAFPLG